MLRDKRARFRAKPFRITLAGLLLIVAVYSVEFALISSYPLEHYYVTANINGQSREIRQSHYVFYPERLIPAALFVGAAIIGSAVYWWRRKKPRDPS